MYKRQQEPVSGPKKNFQVKNSFIVTSTQTGIVIIDQQHAHERILYERFVAKVQSHGKPGQHQLIPQTITLSPGNAQLLLEWVEYFTEIGFEINDFGNGSFVVQAIPMNMENSNIGAVIEAVIESLKSPWKENKLSQTQVLAKALARKLSVKRGKRLHQQEIDTMIENLFACKLPETSPDGKPTMVIISYDEIDKKFKI